VVGGDETDAGDVDGGEVGSGVVVVVVLSGDVADAHLGKVL
jgi:hypothetical protein